MLVQIGKRSPEVHLVPLLEACHQRIRLFARLAVALGNGEATADEVPERCSEVRRYFREALPRHIADEDESIGPRLAVLAPELEVPLMLVHLEHQAHQPLLAMLDRTLCRFASAPLDLDVRASLESAAVQTERAFEEHLQAEEQAIFPVLRSLPSDVEAGILAEMRARRP